MRTQAGAVHSRDLLRGQRLIAWRSGVGSKAVALNGVAGTQGSVWGAVGVCLAEVLNDAIAHGRRGNGAQGADRLGIAVAFVIEEEKETVFENGAANGAPKNIAIELVGLIGLVTGELGRLDEIVVGAEKRVAIVLVDGAVEIIGAALGDQSNLSSGSRTFVGAIVGRGYAKLLNRIKRDGENRGEGMRAFVVHRDPIEGDVALIAVGTIDRAAAGVYILVDVGPVARIDDARLER